MIVVAGPVTEKAQWTVEIPTETATTTVIAEMCTFAMWLLARGNQGNFHR